MIVVEHFDGLLSFLKENFAPPRQFATWGGGGAGGGRTPKKIAYENSNKSAFSRTRVLASNFGGPCRMIVVENFEGLLKEDFAS